MNLRSLLLLAIIMLPACSPGRGIEAWRVLGDIAAGTGASRHKEITPAPTRSPVAYGVEGRSRTGDLYRPGAAAKAALVLVPGAAPAGKDDPRLVAFADTLARARFVVLVPEIANLRQLKVLPADAEPIADAARYLAERRETPSGAVGLIAISYAVGPAVLAALREDTRDKVRFLLAIGGYYDSEALITFVTTGAFREGPEHPWRRGTPNDFGAWVFVRSNADRIVDPRDRVLLSAMAERKLADLDADVDDLAAKLGAEGRSVYALLLNRDPDAVPGLLAALPQGIREDMAGLDLKRRDLSPLVAELILVHGRDDVVIPYTESARLAEAAPPGQADVYLVDNLAHADLGPGDALDVLRLWCATYRVLALRDELAGEGTTR